MHGMSNEEIDDLLFEQRISGDIGNLVAILLGVGLLFYCLVLELKYQNEAANQKTAMMLKSHNFD